MKNKKILITGASGFIGKHLTRYLLEKNYDLTLTYHNKKICKEFKNYTSQILIDLTQKKDFKKISGNIDAVFHLAIFSSFDDSPKTISKLYNVNALGTINLLNRCCATGVKRFINSSSIAIYGTSRKGMVSEKCIPKPESHYGISKLTGELACEKLNKQGKISAISLRYSSVYGTEQHPFTVLPKFINKARENKNIEIRGKGEKVQDFVYVKDVVEANYFALNSNESGSFNISSGKKTNIINLATLIKDIFSSGKSRIILNSKKQGDNTNYYFNISKARKSLGYKVRYPIKKGLSDYKKILMTIH